MKIPESFVPEGDLEKKTEELINKKPILENLIKLNPKRNPLFTAIEELKKEDEIKQFYQEYIGYIKEEGDTDEVRKNAEQVANSNIGYVLGYYSNKTSRKWNKILENVSHPIFGKNYCKEEE